MSVMGQEPPRRLLVRAAAMAPIKDTKWTIGAADKDHKETHALQQPATLFDHLIGAGE
jgi:hypothetical protein